MAGFDNPLHNLLPNTLGEYLDRDIPRKYIAGGTITAGRLVIVNGRAANLAFLTVIRADSGATATSYGKMGYALNDASAGEEVWVTDWQYIIDTDTSAYGAAMDPVYLGAAGAMAVAAGVVPVVVGQVIVKSATVGCIVLDPNHRLGTWGTLFDYGTQNISWTINYDSTASAQNPFLAMIGGDGVVAPNDDIVQSRLTQDSVLESGTFSVQRARNGGAYAYVNPLFNIGRVGETTASLDSILTLNATTAGSVARTVVLSCSGAANAWSLSGNALTTPVAATAAFTLQTGATTSAVANFASGAISIVTGATTESGAFANAVSGSVTIASGVSNSANAGATGANSGNITLRTGYATSTVGATSGNSGVLELFTGNSDDVNSGDIVLRTGTAGTTRGSINATAQNINLRPVGNVNVQDNIPIYAGTTPMVEMRYNAGTWHLDGVEPAGGVSSANGIMETGAVTSVGGARVSGNLTMRSGTSNTNGINGGASGAWVGGTGDTDAASAHIAGASGPVGLQSGDCTSTVGGGTSGTSGNVTIESGFSDDVGTGTVEVHSGNANVVSGATASGGLNLYTGTCGAGAVSTGGWAGYTGAGTDSSTGNVSLASGDSTSATGARTSGGLTLSTGDSTSNGIKAGDSGDVLIETGNVLNATAHDLPESGSVTVRSGTTTLAVAGTADQSGNVRLESGATTVTIGGGGGTGGNSGSMTVTTGNTDVGAGANTGGNSGNLILQSGDAASTAGTSGNSGTASVNSGASADGNTGNVYLNSGSAAGAGAGIVSGNVNVYSGTVGGTGTTGSVTIESGAPIGAGTSGNVALVVGNAPAGVRGNATLSRQGLSGNLGAMVYSPATDSTVAGGAAFAVKGIFDRSVNIPAYMLKAGSVIEIDWMVERTGINAADTQLSELVVGPTAWNNGTDVVINTSSTAAHGANTVYTGKTVITIKAIGAGGTFDAVTQYHDFAAITGAYIGDRKRGAAINTTVQNVIGVTCLFSSNNVGNTSVLQTLNVKVY